MGARLEHAPSSRLRRDSFSLLRLVPASSITSSSRFSASTAWKGMATTPGSGSKRSSSKPAKHRARSCAPPSSSSLQRWSSVGRAKAAPRPCRRCCSSRSRRQMSPRHSTRLPWERRGGGLETWQGTEPQDLVDMTRRVLAARGETIKVIPSRRDGPFGVEMAGEILLPDAHAARANKLRCLAAQTRRRRSGQGPAGFTMTLPHRRSAEQARQRTVLCFGDSNTGASSRRRSTGFRAASVGRAGSKRLLATAGT